MVNARGTTCYIIVNCMRDLVLSSLRVGSNSLTSLRPWFHQAKDVKFISNIVGGRGHESCQYPATAAGREPHNITTGPCFSLLSGSKLVARR
jgi:hypothetical protein